MHNKRNRLEKHLKLCQRHSVNWVIALGPVPKPSQQCPLAPRPWGGNLCGLGHWWHQFGDWSDPSSHGPGRESSSPWRPFRLWAKDQQKMTFFSEMEKFSPSHTGVYVLWCCFTVFWGKCWRLQEFILRWFWRLGRDVRCGQHGALSRTEEIRSTDMRLKFVSIWIVREWNMQLSWQKMERRPGRVL